MKTYFEKMKQSKLLRLYDSLAPQTKAVVNLGFPFLVIDGIHYYTAGSTIAFSLPILLLIFLYCGMTAARFAYLANEDLDRLPSIGFRAGMQLWFLSTILNAALAIVIGAASLGMTTLLGIPYLLFCGPVLFLLSGFLGWVGAYLSKLYYQRMKFIEENKF